MMITYKLCHCHIARIEACFWSRVMTLFIPSLAFH